MDLPEVLRRYEDRITHLEHLPAQHAVVEPWPTWIDPDVRRVFETEGIETLWGHQVEALGHLRSGKHVVVTTGTASGKSLIFQAAALTDLAAGRDGGSLRGFRHPTALYLAPTKALAADQLRRLSSSEHARAITVDGDNSREQREWARNHGNYILTNPDTLHHVLLPGHQRWTRFFAGLRYIVIDECHHYRGVFGAHVAHIVRRLRRICDFYETEPQFILSSATIAEPEQFAARLTGLDVRAVTEDSSPRSARTIAFWEPPLLPAHVEGQPPVRRSATSEAADLLSDLTTAGTRTLAFVRSRRSAEALAQRSQEQLAAVEPQLRERVATYRGGYLPEERRELESRLRSGDLLALACTNALELGIDIAGLDAVVSVGYPGTRAALHQQFGRAGRAGRDSLGVLIARGEPLDTFLVHHPHALLDTALEASVFDPDNPYVLGPHLAAAAQEIPLTEPDLDLFGPRAREGVEAMTQAGWLRQRPAGWFWTRRDRASDLADIRSSGGTPVQIVDEPTGRLVGTVDASSADANVHNGAVYIHQGESYVVAEYDHEAGVAVVNRNDPDYSTQARTTTEVSIVTQRREQRWGEAAITFGDVDVVHQVVSFSKHSRDGGYLVGEELLDLPPRSLRTTAVWWTLSAKAAAKVLTSSQIPGSAHAAEHAAIGLLPFLATCDRWDIGGVSTALHADTGMLTVFVYDGYPGGAGFAERGYEQAQKWLRVTREAIASCACSAGCPSCVYSPKCGNGNEPLDKTGAVHFLDAVLAEAQRV